mmetsp:Transcript_88911/g.154221  ORF Transcript_88911/g.154221 Transcript_88911/m.154221 type:complete len:88 (-) Transcript_88911:8-271(-)
MKMQCAEEQQHEDNGQPAIFGDAIELTATRMMMQHAEQQQCEDNEQSAPPLVGSVSLASTKKKRCNVQKSSSTKIIGGQQYLETPLS